MLPDKGGGMERDMDNMQRLGYSNKLFFHMMHGRNTFSIRFQYEFFEDIEPGSMKESLEEALRLYPEFKIRVLPKNHRFVSQVNDRPIAFFQGIGQEHKLGSDETNGYLFYLAYEKKSLLISYYHGLTDTKGILTFMGTALYYYAQKTGQALSEEEKEALQGKIRFSEADIPEDEMERLDPYGMLADESVRPKNLYATMAASYFTGPGYPEESREVNKYEIEFSLAHLLEKTKEYGVSVGPLLLGIVSRAFCQTESADRSRPVVGMMPVDLRKRFGLTTLVNFSDGVNVPMEEKDLALSVQDLCHKFKSFILDQICPENFIKVMTDKVQMIRSFEEQTKDMKQMAEEMSSLPAPEKLNPVSYAFTYPGNLNMGPGIDRMLQDIYYGCYARYTYITGSTYNDCFRLGVHARNDDGAWAEHIMENLEAIGIDASLKAVGRVKGDICDVF